MSVASTRSESKATPPGATEIVESIRKTGKSGWSLFIAASRVARECGIDPSNTELAEAVFGRQTLLRWMFEDVGARAARVAAVTPGLTPAEAKSLKAAERRLDDLAEQERFLVMAIEQRPERAAALGRVLLPLLTEGVRDVVRGVMAEELPAAMQAVEEVRGR